MANEITVTVRMQAVKGNLNYQSQPATYQADMDTDTPLGPTPGAILVDTAGVDIDLTQITNPGMCRLMNLDETNYIEVGAWDPETSVFYPLLELLPGEIQVVRLSRNFGEQYAGTGTGTTAATNRLRVKANTAACVVLVEAFER